MYWKRKTRWWFQTSLRQVAVLSFLYAFLLAVIGGKFIPAYIPPTVLFGVLHCIIVVDYCSSYEMVGKYSTLLCFFIVIQSVIA